MSFAKKSLSEFKAAAKKASQSTGFVDKNAYNVGKMPEDSKAIIRFIPDKNEENELAFTIELLSHYLTIDGKNKKVPCLKQYDKECPICKKSAEFYKVEGKGSVTGKRLYRQVVNATQALIVEDPIVYQNGEKSAVGTVKILNLTFQLYNKVQSAFNDDDLEEVPWDFENGTDFMIRKEVVPGNPPRAGYTNSKFLRKSRPLTKEEMAVVEEQAINLSTLIPAEIPAEKLIEYLNADLNGSPLPQQSSAPDTSVGSTASIDPTPTPSAAVYGAESSNAVQTETKVEVPISVASDDDDTDDILAQLARNKLAAKAARGETE